MAKERMSDARLLEIQLSSSIMKSLCIDEIMAELEAALKEKITLERLWSEACDEAERVRKRNEDLTRQNAELREKLERLEDWERTILNAPGEAREVALQRFKESDFAKDVVGAWKKENAALKKRVEELGDPCVKVGRHVCGQERERRWGDE